MDTLDRFVKTLRDSMEENTTALKAGRIFAPEHLTNKVFTKTFGRVFRSASRRMGLALAEEQKNTFHRDYDIRGTQRMDYCFNNGPNQPVIFLEQESLDRAQLYLFSDGPVSQNEKKDHCNKLWYYYGTLGNHFTARKPIPRYFVFFLVLLDRQVDRYQLWDIQKPYGLFDRSLAKVVFNNPFAFYDRQIKALARAFLRDNCTEFKVDDEWQEMKASEFQEICELVFITCTGDRLILSRGKHMFSPEKEKSYKIKWHA